jgi:O-antigen/teichoic acid export membrane protein
MFKNIIANYVGKFWSIISVFLFVPFYVKLLGIESYAVISFYTVILTIMYFADGGLSATLNMEIARSSDKLYIGRMLFTIERLYLIICASIILLIFSFSEIIAKNWLNSQSISLGDLSLYISLMGISVAFHLFTTLQSSGLMGLEKQVISNSIQVASSIFRSALVLLPLYFYPTLLTFFLWQVFSNIVFFFITRYSLWKFIRTNATYEFDIKILKTVGRFAGGMMIMAVISSLNTQIDKLVISKFLSLKEFGYYSLAGVLSQVPVLLITPIALAILPRMVKYSANREKDKLKRLFHVNTFILSALSASAAMVLFLFTKDFILIWTHDSLIANSIENVTKVLLIGGVFLSFQYMPYHLAIANGHTRTNVRLGIVALICIIPTLIFFVKQYGMIGATYTWLFMNLFAFLYLGYFIISKFLKNEFRKWLIYNTLIPLGISIIVGLVGYFSTINLPKGNFVIIYSIVIGSINICINVVIFNMLFNKTIKIKLRTLLNNLNF